MRRRPLVPILFVLATVVAAMSATPAMAAKRKVPFGFFGTVLNVEATNPSSVSDAELDQQMALMARSGVESLRVFFPWSDIEKQRQGVFNWARADREVAAAARHRIMILANVLTTPVWASERPNAEYPLRFPPRQPGLYAEFMRQLIQRYGPKGTFWAQNPGVPKVPIRNWQIWNEQMAPWFWSSRPWARSYTKMLKVAYRTIKRADRRATVVAGSFVGVGPYTQWAGVRDLYRAGAKRYFDQIAVHPFTNNPKSVKDTIWRTLEILRRVRAQMRKRRDGRKRIILTELTWPAAVGRVPKRRLLGLETTARGQVKRLSASYKRLAKVRRKMRIAQAYWFAWATPYDDNTPQSDVSYRFAGLNRFADGVFSPLPILRTYSKVAAKYEGCRKSANARRCRG
jgi:hypothetical protein